MRRSRPFFLVERQRVFLDIFGQCILCKRRPGVPKGSALFTGRKVKIIIAVFLPAVRKEDAFVDCLELFNGFCPGFV